MPGIIDRLVPTEPAFVLGDHSILDLGVWMRLGPGETLTHQQLVEIGQALDLGMGLTRSPVDVDKLRRLRRAFLTVFLESLRSLAIARIDLPSR